MRRLPLLFVLPLLLALSACTSPKHSVTAKPGQTAQKFSGERKQVFAAEYLLFLPQGYAAGSAKRWPLILFLHGAGERGANLGLVARQGPPKIDTLT